MLERIFEFCAAQFRFLAGFFAWLLNRDRN